MALATDSPGTYSEHRTAGLTGPRGPQTGRAAYLGITERGPADTVVEVDSYRTFTRRFGNPISTSALPEQVKHHFDLGGGPILVGRNLGASAVRASLALTGTGTTATLWAADYGTYGNGLTATVTHSGTDFDLTVSLDDEVVYGPATFATTADMITALGGLSDDDGNIYVRAVVGGGSGDPAAITDSAFTGGANGTTSDATALTALGLLTPDLGTMQVAFPGDTSSARHAQVKTACEPGAGPRRVPVLDHADSSAATAATAIEALWGGQPAIHCVSSAPLGDSVVYGSVAFCVKKSISDRQQLPGHAIAAGNATFTQLHRLTREYTDAERLVLENAGATVMTLDEPDGRGVRNVQILSDRVGTDPEDEDEIYEASDLIVLCAIDAELRFAQRDFRFANITPQTLGQIHTASNAVGVPFYAQGVISDDDGNGSTGKYEDAFQVQVEQTGAREVTTTAFTRPSASIAVQKLVVVRRTQEA